MVCPKCNGTKFYTPKNQRGTVHSYRCDACCTHESGRWQLSEHHADPGKWCCLSGCGKLWETEHGET